MQQLPDPKTYELENSYFPWGKMTEKALAIINKRSATNGSVLDLMCGPGYLLGKIEQARPDLKLSGIDNDKRYIDYAQNTYPNISFETANCRSWEVRNKYDVIICTGSLHHLPYPDQQRFLEKVALSLTIDGFFILADPFIDDFSSEEERKISAATLGYQYLKATLRNNPPDSIISAAIDIMRNDIFMDEYKTSTKNLARMTQDLFITEESGKTWPIKESQYGDYYFVFTKRQ